MTRLQSSGTNFTLLFFSLVYLIKEFHISVCARQCNIHFTVLVFLVFFQGGGHSYVKGIQITSRPEHKYHWAEPAPPAASTFGSKPLFPHVSGTKRDRRQRFCLFSDNVNTKKTSQLPSVRLGALDTVLILFWTIMEIGASCFFLHHTQTNALVTRRNVLQQGSGLVITKTPT